MRFSGTVTRRRGWPAAALAAVALTTSTLTAGPAEADPAGSVPALLAELRTLYQETGRATEAYHEAAERLAERREETRRVQDRLAATRTELTATREAAGAVARAQYRGGGLQLPPALAMLLGEDPGQALHDQTVAARVAAAEAAEIDRLGSGERAADELATAARAALDAEQAAAEEERHRRDEVHRRLDEVAGLLAGLSPDELTELTRLQEAEAGPGPEPSREPAPEATPEPAPSPEAPPPPAPEPDAVPAAPEPEPVPEPAPGAAREAGPEPGA
ncbi:coiled-coil domain-containing protein [Streptomyces hainanensis]|uniref:NlpC/P60 family protein n=1 Tax=Streptomyces hainanensis TaxID=402648 RepID=A0A4R4TFE7_9ACTN|nr:hypothetical protein [Streptomyces hainanensis]TDC73069.1 hypothetical protein E1283_20045 [Streptomyces hainanensis]